MKSMSIWTRAKFLMGLVVLTVMLAVASFATLSAPSAHAASTPKAHAIPHTASDCEGGANGFVDISDSLSGTVQRSVDMGAGVTVTLESGQVKGAQRGWAKISGQTLQNDQVWMDWTTDGGSTWLQCGPFYVDHDGYSKTSAAKNTSSDPNYQFRACGSLAGVGDVKCTSWW
ncbi:MAG: hypothetical protein JO202_04705 [Ktedonobacteraceae bacterium]|nr:hypothetical protein [Ktedonobacteraceae bacterium]